MKCPAKWVTLAIVLLAAVSGVAVVQIRGKDRSPEGNGKATPSRTHGEGVSSPSKKEPFFPLRVEAWTGGFGQQPREARRDLRAIARASERVHPGSPRVNDSESEKPPRRAARKDGERPPQSALSALAVSREDVIRERDQAFAYTSRAYGVTFEPEGVLISSRASLPDLGRPLLSFSLSEVRMGDEVLARGGGIAPQVRPEERQVYYPRGSVEERYVLKKGVVEQLFVIRDLLPVRGEITVSGTIDTNVDPPADGTNASGLSFTHEGREVLFVKEAVAFDASGKRLDLQLAYSGGRMTLTLPAGWVAAADLPITVDPNIGSPFVVDPSSPDLHEMGNVYNPTSNQWFLVWDEEIGGNPSEYDVYGQRIDAAGQLLGSALLIGNNPGIDDNPEVSHAPGPNRYLVAWSDDTGGGSRVVGRVVNADGTFFTGIVTLADLSGFDTRPSIAFDGTNWFVAYANDNAGQKNILGRFVATSGTPGTAVTVDSESDSADFPSVDFTSGTYLIGWKKGTTLWGFSARTMNTSGTFLTSITTVEGPNGVGGIDVSARSGQFLLCWALLPNGLLGAVYNTSLGVDAGPFTICPLNDPPSLSCQATYSPTSDLWYVVFDDPDGLAGGLENILGARVTPTGGVAPPDLVGFLAETEKLPHVSCNSATNEVLVSYYAIQGASQTVHAQRFSLNLPSTPGSFSGTAVSTTEINWTWAPAYSATGYVFHDAGDNLVTGVGGGPPALERFLSENTCFTRHIHGTNEIGGGPASATVSRFTKVRNAQIGDFAFTIITPTQIVLTIVPPVNANHGLTGCRIEKSTDSFNWSTIKDFTVPGYAHTDTAVTPGSTYYYKVTYCNGDSIASTTSGLKSVVVPALAPTGFMGSSLSTTSIQWNWNDLGTETGYQLHDEACTNLASLPQNATQHVETGLTENRAVKRHVHGVVAGALTAASAIATVYSRVHDPPATSEFTLVPVSGTRIDILVAPRPPNPTSGQTAVKVERSPAGAGTWTEVKAFGTPGYSATDTGVSSGPSYDYRITYRNGSGVQTAPSGIKSTTSVTPGTPGGFQGTAQSTSTILWQWSSASGATAYQVHDGAEAVVGTTTGLSFTEVGLLENTQYTRHVHGVNGQIKSAASTPVAKFTWVHEPVAADLAVKIMANNQVQVVVTPPPNSGNAAVQIDRKKGNAPFSTVKAFGVAGYAYTDNDIQINKTYTYRIKFRNGDLIETGFFTDSQITITGPATPTGLAGVAQSSSSVKWTWNDVSGETGYKLHDTAHTLEWTTGPQTATFVETGLTENTSYTRHVHSVNGTATSAASTSASATTPVHDPLVADVAALVVSQTSIEITVVPPAANPTLNQTGYQVQRSQDATNWTIAQDFTNASYTFVDSPLPVAGGTYLYRIRYRNSAGAMTSESPPRTVTMTPVLLAPANDAATADTTPDFDWSDVPGKPALTYEIQVDTEPTFSVPLTFEQTGLSASSTTAPGALAQGLYYWQVRAKFNGANFGSYSSIRTFRVDTSVPGTPTPLTPSSTSQTPFAGVASPTFDWTEVSDPAGVSYRLQVDNDPAFGSPEVDVANITGSTFKIAVSLAEGTQYWRVQSKDGAGNVGSYSSAASFIVDLTAPGAPNLLSPADTVVVSTPTPVFDWSDVTDVTGVTYRLQVDTDSTFSSPLELDLAGIFPSYVVPALCLEDGSYVWRVTATDGVGRIGSSSIFRFVVDGASGPAGPCINVDVGRKTRDTTPEIRGTSSEIPGITITVYFDGMSVGTTSVDGQGNWLMSPSGAQSEGSHVVTAVASKSGFPDSASSNSVLVTIDTFVTPPSNVTASPLNGHIHLSWVASPDSDVVGYQIYRSVDGGAFGLLNQSQLITDIRYCDEAVLNGTPYAYFVRAVDDALQN